MDKLGQYSDSEMSEADSNSLEPQIAKTTC